MTRGLRFLPWIALAALYGCGGVLTSDQPAEHDYWLEAVTLEFGEPPTAGLPDLVVAVRAVPGLDTDRILVRGPGARMNYYAGARWPEHLPEVIDALVRQAFESSGRFDRVGSGSRSNRDDWSLELELREFFAVVTSAGAPPRIQVKLAGHVVCGSDDSAVSAAASIPAAADGLAAIVAAFQGATDSTLTDLGRQLESRCFGRRK